MKKMGMMKAWMAGVCIGAFVGGTVGAVMDEMCSGINLKMIGCIGKKIRKML